MNGCSYININRGRFLPLSKIIAHLKPAQNQIDSLCIYSRLPAAQDAQRGGARSLRGAGDPAGRPHWLAHSAMQMSTCCPCPGWAAPGEAPGSAGGALGTRGCPARLQGTRGHSGAGGPLRPPRLPRLRAPFRPGEAVSARCQLSGFIAKGRQNNEALSL